MDRTVPRPTVGAGLVRLARAVSAASRRRAADPGHQAGTFADDDLPGFLASPPGTPPATTPAPPPSRSTSQDPPARPTRRREVAVLLAAAVAVVLLSAVAVALVRAAVHPAAAGPATAPSSSAASPLSLPAPAPPASPSPGDPGAGELAGTDLSMGPGVVAARLTTAGLVLRRVPAGVTAGFPRVSLTASSDRAVVHLELPIANCLSSSAPAQLEGAGCQPVATEFADLPTPSLRIGQSGDRLTFWGRFPTYLRPSGGSPVWTGRTRQVTVTLDLPAVTGSGALPASGSVAVDGRTTAALPDPGLSTVTYGH